MVKEISNIAPSEQPRDREEKEKYVEMQIANNVCQIKTKPNRSKTEKERKRTKKALYARWTSVSDQAKLEVEHIN